MKVLINERLSQHKYKTPEGYLICQDAILARTGKQTYTRGDVFGQDTKDAESDIEVDRKYEEVFSPKTLASFENKPVTVEHPDEDVNVDNYKEYAVGFVRDVKQGKIENGEDVILGTLVITDAQTIKEIEDGEHTELSCGYDCDIIDEDNPQQRNIRGNHVALCEHGRAGIAKIVDSWKGRDAMTYKGYKLEEAKYLHDEEIGAKIAITKNGIIVGGADSYEEAKSKIDNMKSEKDLHYSKDSIKDSITVNCPNMTLQEMKDYCDAFGNCEVYNTGVKGKYRLEGHDAREAYEELKSDGYIQDSVKDVNPRSGESKDEFISRFMEETKSEYPDEKQRLAVAHSYWEKKGRDSIKDKEPILVKKVYPLTQNYIALQDYHDYPHFWVVQKKNYHNEKEYYGGGVLEFSLNEAKKFAESEEIMDRLDKKYGKAEGYKRYISGQWDSVKDDFDRDYAYESRELENDIKRAKELYKKGDKSPSQILKSFGYKEDGEDAFYQEKGHYTKIIEFTDFDSRGDIKYYVLKDGKIPSGWTLTRAKFYDSIKDEDKYIVWADGTKQGNRALYRTATGNAQYCYSADAHQFSKDEAIKLTNQKGGKYTWVMKKVGDSLKKYEISYTKDGNEYIHIVRANSLGDAISKIK